MSRWTAAAVLGLAAASGCKRTEVLSDYQLQLVPRTPSNQAPFADGPQVSLVLRESTEVRISTLGDLDSGSVSGEAFGPLDQAMVGVLLQTSGSEADTYQPGRLVAYGEVGPLDLGLGEESIEREVLLAAYGGIGELGDLTDYGALLAAAAMTSAGDVVMFGGAGRAGPLKPGTDAIRRLTDLDGGDWAFREVSTLPDTLVGATATRLEGDPELLLVAGGRPRMDDFLGHRLWHLYDPAADTIVDGGDDMEEPRSGHLAHPMSDGTVLLVGGLADDGLPYRASFEIFDPDDLDFEYGERLELPSLGAALADLGLDGALVCGGGDIVGEAFVDGFLAVDDCARIALRGQVHEAAPLPVPLQHHAMAPLPDGRVLVCGGVTGEVLLGETGEATDQAWVYAPDTDTWTPIAPMVHPRALHAAFPTPDGRVVVVGGSDRGGHVQDGDIGTPVDCPEVFDPQTLTFEQGPACGLAGSGARPAVAAHPDHGAVVVAGMDADEAGGEAYGIVGFGPDL